ncbi:MAG: MG2 domain-containing protein [Bacteroidota bacterium]
MKNLKSLLLTCTAMILGTHVFSQSAPPPATNTVKLFFEKAFIHTDRSIYAPGEDIWMKGYVVNAQDNHLIGTSKNLYVELIAPADTIAAHEIIRLDNGTGTGDFLLPTKIPAGNYRLRAYTNWMRNFGDNFIFEKIITITGNTSPGKTSGTSSAAGKSTAKTTAVSASSTTPVIRFFPEGGSLVNEISAIVAVKAEDALGHGIAVSGPILSATGDTVARFTCDSLGMGLFAMVPLAGQKYHSTLKYNGQTINATVPDALNSGLSLKATKRDTLIYITISANTTAAAALAGKPLTLSVKHAGAVYIDQQIHLNDNQAAIKIPESILPEGIAAITLYDDQHKPNCERLIYVNHPSRNAKLSVTTEKNTFKPRERVTVNIKATDANHHPVAGNFSLAAVDAGVDPYDAGSISAYILLQSEIRGQITHPERYFDTTNVNRTRQLDMLMLTQGWRDFVWKRLADTAIKISYLPEQGFTIAGSVKTSSGKTAIPGANVTLYNSKTTGQKLFFTKTDAAGNYYFDNLQLSGEQSIMLTTRDDKGKANGYIQMDSLLKNSLPVNKANKFGTINLSDELAAELQRRLPVNKNLDSITHLQEVKIKASKNVVLRDQTAVSSGYADESFTVTQKDFSFNTLRDYILYESKQAKPDPNNLDQVVFFADGKTYHPRIIINNKEEIFTEEDDADVQGHYYSIYYSLPMNVVEKVLIKRMLAGLKPPKISTNQTANAMGNSIANTRIPPPENLFIIYLTLKPGAMFANGGGVTNANIQGYYEARSFYAPLHNGESFDSSKPDMRNTIHWAPAIKTDANGQASVTFYNADPKTNVRIVVQGVTNSGEPLNAVKGYVVK